MQTCINCGTLFDGYACPRCGMQPRMSAQPNLNMYCPGCGAQISSGFNNCPYCARKLDPPSLEFVTSPPPQNNSPNPHPGTSPPDPYAMPPPYPEPYYAPVPHAPRNSGSGKTLLVIAVALIIIIAAIAGAFMFIGNFGSFDSAIEISDSDTITGTLGSSDIDVFYKIMLSPGDVLEANLTGPDAADFDLYAYENERFLDKYIIVGSANESSEESLRFVAWEDDYYIIDVFSFEGSGSYTLNVAITDTISLDDGDNALDDAAAIESGVAVEGDLNEYYDQDDYYWIHMDSGQVLSAFLDVPDQVNTDFDLYIYNEYGDELDISEAQYGNEAATVYGTYTGDYFVNAWAYDGIGGYRLLVEIETGPGADSNNDMDSALAVHDGDRITDSLSQYDDTEDYYSVYLDSGQFISIVMDGPADADFDLYLLDSDGYIAASSGDITSYETIDFTPMAGGTYYINPSAYSGFGDYTLDIGTGGGGSIVANAGNDRTVGTGWIVNFDGSDSAGAITSYLWDFGDGSAGIGITQAHVYNTIGNYTVTLTVSDGANNDTDTAAITVGDSAEMPEKFALVIGISDYQGDGDLTFCDEDADSWTAHLESQGYTVHTLVDSEASATEIMNEIEWLEGQEEAGDYVAFVFSGHGSYSDRTRSSYICAWNIEESDGFISDAQLGTAFANFESQHMFFFFDSCHSGGMDSVAGDGRYVSQTAGQLEYGLDDYKHQHGMWTYWYLVYAIQTRGNTDLTAAHTVAYPYAVADAAELDNAMHPEEEFGGTDFYL